MSTIKPTRTSSHAPTEAERRIAPRAEVQTEVNFESENNFFTGFTEDISEGGLFVVTYDLKAIGTEIELRFTLPDGHIVNATCIVRWTREPRDLEDGTTPGMGLQFERLAAEDREAIQFFIETRAPMFYED